MTLPPSSKRPCPYSQAAAKQRRGGGSGVCDFSAAKLVTKSESEPIGTISEVLPNRVLVLSVIC